jgi:hypothetical protein
MSILSQFSALAMGEIYSCDSARNIYERVVGNINSSTEGRFGNKVSEDVANFVSTPPVSDNMGDVNKVFEYLTSQCSIPETVIRRSMDYNQNIYDSLELYKGTTPQAIPEFGELSIIMIGLSFVGIVALTKRHEIVSAMKKLKTRLRIRF